MMPRTQEQTIELIIGNYKQMYILFQLLVDSHSENNTLGDSQEQLSSLLTEALKIIEYARQKAEKKNYNMLFLNRIDSIFEKITLLINK